MKEKIFILETIDEGVINAYVNLEDAKARALDIIYAAYDDETQDYEDTLAELNETYDKYKGFWVDGWLWCYPIELYR